MLRILSRNSSEFYHKMTYVDQDFIGVFITINFEDLFNRVSKVNCIFSFHPSLKFKILNTIIKEFR